MITTVGAVIDDAFFDIGAHVTTPGAVELQSFLARMVRAGTDYAILETTSHALDQLRVYHCAYDVAVITNITHEHFDYHGSYEHYRDAKAMLFRSLMTTYRKPGVPKVSVLNADDASFEYLRRIDADVTLAYGLVQPADFRAKDILHTSEGTRFTAITPIGDIHIEMALLGDHNVYNALAAIATAYARGIPLEAIKQGIESVKGVVARMERVDCGQDFDVFVDYAHTPNALEHILRSARSLTHGQVIVVFGLSGGPRDKTKRPIMGEIAGKLADKVVITSVDWYTEHIDTILGQIAAGCKQADRQEGVDYWCIPDRKAGISFGIGLARRGDIVIIAGKGHERVISYNSVDHPWDEFEAVRDALKARQ
jgi:UDP-N-acetylmuramoyl-L-alanyl-D-glutamate--2,6-diaminopimelate ligase